MFGVISFTVSPVVKLKMSKRTNCHAFPLVLVLSIWFID